MINKLYFFTATILEWKHLLLQDVYKSIIIDSLSFMVKNKRVEIYSFVIMPNHLHLIWDIQPPHILSDVQRDFLKFTGQQLKFQLAKDNLSQLEKFLVNSKDRKYQIWERNPLSVELISLPVIEQKINYIHCNPIREKWNLAKDVTDYKYSSARFYYGMDSEWDFLSPLKL